MTDRQKLLNQIADFLSGSPHLQTREQRRAVLIRSGLGEFLGKIDLEGTTATFLTVLLDILSNHGALGDGRDSLTAFLDGQKDFLGLDRSGVLDTLIDRWEDGLKLATEISDGLHTYLTNVAARWSNVYSPMLPMGISLCEVAIDLRITDTGTTLGNAKPGPDEGIQGRSRSRQVAPGLREMQLLDIAMTSSAPMEWALVGDPGCGKTTALIMTAARLAELILCGRQGRIPLLVSLPALAAQITADLGYSLNDYVNDMCRSEGLLELAHELQKANRNGRLILLVDGLDELEPANRQRAIERIRSVASTAGNVVLYATRRIGLGGLGRARVLALQGLSLNEQRAFLLRICGPERTTRLLGELAGSAGLREMASNPMMLTILALLANEYADLHGSYLERHSDLLRIGTQFMLEGRHRSGVGVKDARRAEVVLARGSLRLHRLLSECGGADVFSLTDAESAFETSEPMPWTSSRTFLEDVVKNSGLIYSTDPLGQNFRYLHRSIREYWSALEVSKWKDEDIAGFLTGVLTNSAFGQVILFVTELSHFARSHLLAHTRRASELALGTLSRSSMIEKPAAEELLRTPVSARERRLVFQQLRKKSRSDQELVEALAQYLDELGEKIPRSDLYYAHEILRDMGTDGARELLSRLLQYLPVVPDGLFEAVVVGSKRESYWCTVAEGEFIIGAAATDPLRPSWVVESLPIWVSEFRIARVPITNSIYETFDPVHASLREFRDSVEERELDSHPVTGVSWYEAMVFCWWARQKYPGVRLPTEAEWEKAASWTPEGNKLRFPWGNEWNPSLLNSWDLGPNRTTLVGSYEGGQSPVGALDMAGNVWEWCLDTFVEDIGTYVVSLKTNPKNPVSFGEGRRVGKGGGWLHSVGTPANFVRAADEPADSFESQGFRLVESTLEHGFGPVDNVASG